MVWEVTGLLSSLSEGRGSGIACSVQSAVTGEKECSFYKLYQRYLGWRLLQCLSISCITTLAVMSSTLAFRPEVLVSAVE